MLLRAKPIRGCASVLVLRARHRSQHALTPVITFPEILTVTGRDHDTVADILGSLVSRYRREEVLTTIRRLPAREAKFLPVPAWVTSTLAEGYRNKGIRELCSNQAITASGKTFCYNLPVLNAGTGREGRDSRVLTWHMADGRNRRQFPFRSHQLLCIMGYSTFHLAEEHTGKAGDRISRFYWIPSKSPCSSVSFDAGIANEGSFRKSAGCRRRRISR